MNVILIVIIVGALAYVINPLYERFGVWIFFAIPPLLLWAAFLNKVINPNNIKKEKQKGEEK